MLWIRFDNGLRWRHPFGRLSDGSDEAIESNSSNPAGALMSSTRAGPWKSRAPRGER
jgi:hypothetical protein